MAQRYDADGSGQGVRWGEAPRRVVRPATSSLVTVLLVAAGTPGQAVTVSAGPGPLRGCTRTA
jgi:hypothetical protein